MLFLRINVDQVPALDRCGNRTGFRHRCVRSQGHVVVVRSDLLHRRIPSTIKGWVGFGRNPSLMLIPSSSIESKIEVQSPGGRRSRIDLPHPPPTDHEHCASHAAGRPAAVRMFEAVLRMHVQSPSNVTTFFCPKAIRRSIS